MSAALFYLGSRALITRFLWSRYPRRIDEFMSCAACSGFWFGFLLAGLGSWTWRVPFLGLDSESYLTCVVVGLCSIVTTPIVAGLMQAGLDHVGIPTPLEREIPKWTDIS